MFRSEIKIIDKNLLTSANVRVANNINNNENIRDVLNNIAVPTVITPLI